MVYSGAPWRTVEDAAGAGTVFLGEYRHTLDPKSRVVLPAKFRQQLEDGCAVMQGEDECVLLVPKEVWDEEYRPLASRQKSSKRSRHLARALFAPSDLQRPDGQGRIFINERLRHYAHLDDASEVVIAGLGDRIEIWQPARWEQALAIGDEELRNRDEEEEGGV